MITFFYVRKVNSIPDFSQYLSVKNIVKINSFYKNLFENLILILMKNSFQNI